MVVDTQVVQAEVVQRLGRVVGIAGTDCKVLVVAGIALPWLLASRKRQSRQRQRRCNGGAHTTRRALCERQMSQ